MDSSGIRPLPGKVAVIADSPRPSTFKEPSHFLGLMNYFCHFILNAASIRKPLHTAVDHKCPLKSNTWSDLLLSAFLTAKPASQQ